MSQQLDVCFTFDTTGSMGSWIEATKKNIIDFMTTLDTVTSSTRFALVPYKDYCDGKEVVVKHDFSGNKPRVQQAVNLMEASGGGDCPEAVGAGLEATLELSWRPQAVKVCVVIADAPPHGLECDCCCGDSMPKGEVDGRDPVAACHAMRRAGIRTFSIGCGLSCIRCIAYYSGIARLTGGMYMDLTDSSQLLPAIEAAVRQELDLSNLDERIYAMADAARAAAPSRPLADIAEEIAGVFQTEGVTVHAAHAAAAKTAATEDGAIAVTACLADWRDEMAFAQEHTSTLRRNVAPPAEDARSGKSNLIQPRHVLRVLVRRGRRAGIRAAVDPAAGRIPVTPKVQLLRYLRLGLGDQPGKTKDEVRAEFIAHVTAMLSRGEDVVPTLVAVATGLAPPKPEATLLALALAMRHGDDKAEVGRALLQIARTPTHLFEYIAQCKALGSTTGWGRAQRRAVASWYVDNKPGKVLANSVTKMWNRKDFTHTDVLRLAHPRPSKATTPEAEAINVVLSYIAARNHGHDKLAELLPLETVAAQAHEAEAKGDVAMAEVDDDDFELVDHDKENGGDKSQKSTRLSAVEATRQLLAAAEVARGCKDEATVVALIQQHRLSREHIPTELLSSPGIWSALLPHMGPTALLRNLNKLTSLELLAPGTPGEGRVLAVLRDMAGLARAKVNPLDVLVAADVYSTGKGDKGSLEWTPAPRILEALENGFMALTRHLAKTMAPSPKRVLLGVDLRASMLAKVGSTTGRKAAAATALVWKTVNPHWRVVAFGEDGVIPVELPADATLTDAMALMEALPPGPADPASLLADAADRNEAYDAVVAFTARGIYRGDDPLADQLSMYRQLARTPEAMLVSVTMAPTSSSLSSPHDAGMADLVFSPGVLDEINGEMDWVHVNSGMEALTC